MLNSETVAARSEIHVARRHVTEVVDQIFGPVGHLVSRRALLQGEEMEHP